MEENQSKTPKINYYLSKCNGDSLQEEFVVTTFSLNNFELFEKAFSCNVGEYEEATELDHFKSSISKAILEERLTSSGWFLNDV
jgi:hypothetical protein